MDMNLSKLQEIVKDRETWRAAVHGVPKSWPQLSNWTTTNYICSDVYIWSANFEYCLVLPCSTAEATVVASAFYHFHFGRIFSCHLYLYLCFYLAAHLNTFTAPSISLCQTSIHSWLAGTHLLMIFSRTIHVTIISWTHTCFKWVVCSLYPWKNSLDGYKHLLAHTSLFLSVSSGIEFGCQELCYQPDCFSFLLKYSNNSLYL